MITTIAALALLAMIVGVATATFTIGDLSALAKQLNVHTENTR